MAVVSIYNLLRTVAQVQVAKAIAKVDDTLVSMPNMTTNEGDEDEAGPEQSMPTPRKTAPQQTQVSLTPQARASLERANLQTIIEGSEQPIAKQIVPDMPQKQLPVPIPLSPPQTFVRRQTSLSAATQPVKPEVIHKSVHIPVIAQNNQRQFAPVPVRATTLASLPLPELFKASVPNNTHPQARPLPPIVQPAQVMQEAVEEVSKFVARVVEDRSKGAVSDTQAVKLLVAGLLAAPSRPSVSVPLNRVSRGMNTEPFQTQEQRPTPSVSALPLPTQSSQRSIDVPIVVLRMPVVTVLPETQMATPFPQVLTEQITPQPIAQQVLATMLNAPVQLKDMASLVAYYAAMLPGWPNPDAMKLQKPLLVPRPTIELAKAIKHLSPEQQIALLSRLGLPLPTINVLQKMLKDLEKRLNERTVSLFLAALIGTLSFVLEEVYAFFDKNESQVSDSNSKI